MFFTNSIIYGRNIINPVIIETKALTKTAPALTSLAYLIFTLYSTETVSHNASIALLIVSDIKTIDITKLNAIQSV